MGYQPKTTMIKIIVGVWTEQTSTSLALRFDAVHAIATLIASRCGMDIASFVPYSLGGPGYECQATVVYVNNGRSLKEIREAMKPETDNNPQRYWMIQDFEIWQGVLHCIASTKDADETWS